MDRRIRSEEYKSRKKDNGGRVRGSNVVNKMSNVDERTSCMPQKGKRRISMYHMTMDGKEPSTKGVKR
jgi:hypothetical protein